MRLAPVAAHIVERVVEGVVIEELPGQPVGRGHWPDDLPFAADRAYRGRRFPGNDTDCVGVFGEPMAYAIIGGLFVATVLTLFLLALLYRLHLHQGACKGATGGNQRTRRLGAAL